MNKHLTLIPVTGLVFLTLAGCAATPNSNSAGSNSVTNSTANTSGVNDVSNSTGAANNTPSNTGHDTNSVQVSVSSTTTPESYFANEIALIKNKGYSMSGTTPTATVKTTSGDTLTAWITTATQSQDGYNHLVFFFLNGKYIGIDTTKPSLEITSAKAAGYGIAVTYPVYKKSDSFANATGTPVTITYTWNGLKLVANKAYPKQFQANNTNHTSSTTPFGDAQTSFYMVNLNLTHTQISMIKSALEKINGNPNTMEFGNGGMVYVPAKVSRGTQLLSASAGSSKVFGTYVNLTFSQFDFALSEQLPSDIEKTKYSIRLSNGSIATWYVNKPGTGGTTYFLINKAGKTYLIYYSNLKLISSALIDKMGSQWVSLGTP